MHYSFTCHNKTTQWIEKTLGLSIYIPWPFPPVWGVADITKETTKTMGVSLRSSSNDEGPSRVGMALLEQHSPSSPIFHNLRRLEFGEGLISSQLPLFHVVSEENYTEEGIPSPLAPSLLVAFYDTQRIRWCYSLLYAQHHRAYIR